MTSSLIAHNFNDEFEHSGDYESGITQSNAPVKTKTVATDQPSQTHRPNDVKKNDLQGDINDFLELIPVDDVKDKIEEYYRNDMDVQHVYDYLISKEFYELRKHILDIQDVKELLQYLNRKGLNVKMMIRKIGHRLGISKMRPIKQTHNVDAVNLGNLFQVF